MYISSKPCRDESLPACQSFREVAACTWHMMGCRHISSIATHVQSHSPIPSFGWKWWPLWTVLSAATQATNLPTSTLLSYGYLKMPEVITMNLAWACPSLAPQTCRRQAGTCDHALWPVPITPENCSMRCEVSSYFRELLDGQMVQHNLGVFVSCVLSSNGMQRHSTLI